MQTNEVRQKQFVGYEYKELTAESSQASFLIDGYENFGWELDENLLERSSAKYTVHWPYDERSAEGKDAGSFSLSFSPPESWTREHTLWGCPDTFPEKLSDKYPLPAQGTGPSPAHVP